jgi:uncharacterized protein (DUF2141 family)
MRVTQAARVRGKLVLTLSLGEHVMRATWLALVAAVVPWTAAAADLTVRIDGVAPLGGTLRVGVFASAEAFVARGDGVLVSENLPAAGERAEVTFADLAPGRYAVTAHHDADDDRELDRIFRLVPAEGVALSTNPSLLRVPAFDDIAVTVEDDVEVTLTLVYLLGVQTAAER